MGWRAVNRHEMRVSQKKPPGRGIVALGHRQQAFVQTHCALAALGPPCFVEGVFGPWKIAPAQLMSTLKWPQLPLPISWKQIGAESISWSSAKTGRSFKNLHLQKVGFRIFIEICSIGVRTQFPHGVLQKYHRKVDPKIKGDPNKKVDPKKNQIQTKK